MAVSSSSYYNNAINGIPQVGVNIDITTENATPKFTIGHLAERSDGARFRYSHFGAATRHGVLVAQDYSESTVMFNYITVVAPASSQTTTDGTAGYKYIEATISGVTADQFAGAYLTVCNNTGCGYSYRVKGNTATGTPASGNIRIELYEPLRATLDATSDLNIIGNKYGNLEIAVDSTSENVLAGVTVCTISTADYYGWVQTRGIIGVLQDNTLNVGDIVALSTTISGAVEPMGKTDTFAFAYGKPLVGNCVGYDVTGGWASIDLMLE